MPKPTPVETIEADAGTDRPNIWRATALDLSTKFNALLAQIGAFTWEFLAVSDQAAARQAMGIQSTVFNYWTQPGASSFPTFYTALSMGAPSHAVGGADVTAGVFTAPRAGYVRCSIGQFDNNNTSGVSLQFTKNSTGQNPVFIHRSGSTASAVAVFACVQGDVFGVSIRGQASSTGTVVLSGVLMEMVA